jgi:ribosome-associated translation inhibitor RaiA
MTLKWNLVTKGMRAHAQMQTKLEQKIAKLEMHLEHFPPDAVHLLVNLERHPKRDWFDTALTLRLPSNILQSEKSGPDPITAFDQAVKALLREVAGFKSALRRESDWQRVARRKL